VNAPVTCVYRAYEDGELVATGRMILDALPAVGDEVRLNGRPYVVHALEFGGGEHVLMLEPR
jgi:hypothetical protein